MNLYELTTSYYDRKGGRSYNYRSFNVVADSMDRAVAKIRKDLARNERVEESRIIRTELDGADSVLRECQEYLRKIVKGFDEYDLGKRVAAALQGRAQEAVAEWVMPEYELLQRILYYAVKAAEHENGVHLIPRDEEDAEIFLDKLLEAVEANRDEILDRAAPPSPTKDTQETKK